jgi:tetratricopeptide (TPR) repeat protein
MLVTVPLVLLLLDYWPLGRLRLPPLRAAPPETAAETPSTDDPQDAEEEDKSEDAAEPDPSDDEDESPEADETDIASDDDIAGDDHFPSEPAEQPPADESGKLPLSYLITEKIPLLVLVALSAAITYGVQQSVGAMGMLGQVPLQSRLGNALFAYGQYLEKSFWPSPLAAIYPYVNRNLIDVLIRGLALAAISVAAIRLARIRPFLIVGWCWFLGTLVPVIGLVQVGVQSMADRYTYIPLIGIFIIAAWGAAEFTAEWPARNKAIVAALVLTVCGWLTWRQVATWSSSEALFSHAVEAERYNIFAQHGLGKVFWKDGKLDEAQQQFEAILKIQSDPALHATGGLEPVHRALGLLLAVRHQPKKALEQLDDAIKDRPQQPEPYRHKAWILATSLDDKVRDGKAAVACAEQALQRSPRKPPEYWDTLAAAQAEAGQFKEAVESAEKALQQAQSMRADDLIPGIQRRLELFKSGMPYRAVAQYPQRL